MQKCTIKHDITNEQSCYYAIPLKTNFKPKDTLQKCTIKHDTKNAQSCYYAVQLETNLKLKDAFDDEIKQESFSIFYLIHNGNL